MRSSVSRTSSLVTATSVNPLMRAAWPTTTASNHPQRRARPVVAPNSLPSLRTRSPISSSISVGSGPAPTRVVYAFTMPSTASIDVGAVPTRGGDAAPDPGAAARRAARRQVRIRAVVDVEQRALRALEQHRRAGLLRAIHHQSHVLRERQQRLAEPAQQVEREVGVGAPRASDGGKL